MTGKQEWELDKEEDEGWPIADDYDEDDLDSWDSWAEEADQGDSWSWDYPDPLSGNPL